MSCKKGLVEGTVISINTSYACFEVEGSIRVHMSVYMIKHKTQNLPVPGNKILIQNCHRSGSTYVACGSTIVEGNFSMPCPSNAFLNLVSMHQLGPADIFKFDEIAKKIKKDFNNIDEELETSILLALFQNLISLAIRQGSTTRGEKNCCDSTISKFCFNTVENCRYVEIVTDKFSDFPYWSFGVHPNQKNTVLFGYLEIEQSYGFFMLKDGNYRIVCEVTNTNLDTDLSQFQNCYVLIEKYTVMTEIFNDNKVPNIEYIIVNIEDINVIHAVKNNNTMFGNQPRESAYCNISHIILQKKSRVCIGLDKSPELILQVFIKSVIKGMGHESKEIYLVLPLIYVPISMQLKEGLHYKFYYQTLNEIINPELKRIKNLKIYKVPDQSCYFEPIGIKSSDAPLLTVLECKSHIQNTNELVSFRGTIKSKRFTEPLPSRTHKKSKMYGFGVPGRKSHQIVFSQTSENTTIFLDYYLNNWENLLMPLGLVPQMEVIVKQVYPQSKKYLKSTIFTNFEIVSYNPLMRFSTCNLYENHDVDWGVQSYLSDGSKVPIGVLIWGQVFSIFILKVSIISKCEKCKQIVSKSTQCNCNESGRELEFTARFNAMDHLGKNVVNIKSLKVLGTILNISPNNFNEWITGLHNIGTYNYNYFDGVNYTGIPLCDYLTNYFVSLKDRKLVLDLKCRKLESSRLVNQTRPYWLCIDARRR